MEQTITAIYENGVLRPLTSLALPEHAQVHISIQLPPDAAAAQRQVVDAVLVAAGLMQPRHVATSPQVALSPERREALADLFGNGKPLSEIVIEEREGR